MKGKSAISSRAWASVRTGIRNLRGSEGINVAGRKRKEKKKKRGKARAERDTGDVVGVGSSNSSVKGVNLSGIGMGNSRYYSIVYRCRI